jgi:hypothetical protein
MSWVSESTMSPSQRFGIRAREDMEKTSGVL